MQPHWSDFTTPVSTGFGLSPEARQLFWPDHLSSGIGWPSLLREVPLLKLTLSTVSLCPSLKEGPGCSPHQCLCRDPFKVNGPAVPVRWCHSLSMALDGSTTFSDINCPLGVKPLLQKGYLSHNEIYSHKHNTKK